MRFPVAESADNSQNAKISLVMQVDKFTSAEIVV